MLRHHIEKGSLYIADRYFYFHRLWKEMAPSTPKASEIGEIVADNFLIGVELATSLYKKAESRRLRQIRGMKGVVHKACRDRLPLELIEELVGWIV